MKLEFLDDLSAGGKYRDVVSEQLLRLYDFDSVQAKVLIDAIEKSIIETHKELDFGSLEIITPINCSLILQLANEDIGLTTVDKENFVCSLTEQAYKKMILLMEPFYNNESHGYQWLYELDCPIDFLFSPGGTW